MRHRIKKIMAQHKDIEPGRIIVRGMIITVILLCVLSAGCSMIDDGRVLVAERFSSDKEMDAVVDTVDVFFGLLIEKNYSEAYNYLSTGDKNNRNEQDFIIEFSDITDIISVEINWVEVKNNIALVGIDIVDNYDEEEKMYKDIEVSLIKEEDESWKIVFWN